MVAVEGTALFDPHMDAVVVAQLQNDAVGPGLVITSRPTRNHRLVILEQRQPEILTAAGLGTEGEEVEAGVVADEFVGVWVPVEALVGDGVFKAQFPHARSRIGR